MSAHRFNLYALGTRRALIRVLTAEASYWSNLDETIIGAVVHDLTDDDYGWVMLARDRIGRFRAAIPPRVSFSSERQAEASLRLAIAEIERKRDVGQLGLQGDEPNAPFDLLTIPTGTEARSLHPFFRELIDRSGRAPARAIIREIGPWLAPKDPHFVREFQRSQFDQRLWELYLWAALRELGFDIEQLDAPDFACSAPGISFTVEATTVASSTKGPLSDHPNPTTVEETAAFLDNYMPIKYGSSLTSKTNKINKNGTHYWKMNKASGKPFVLAIADFHKPGGARELGSMTFTHSALWQYLYGQRVSWEMRDGVLILVPNKIEGHSFGGKAIPSGFFDQPKVENVSAVLFSNAGTIAKFDRMGVVAGFAAPKHRYFRVGFESDPDPNAVLGKPFSRDVLDPHYEEYWADELQVFHNPNALTPLPMEWLPGLTHHWFEDGNLVSYGRPGTVLTSYTMLVELKGD